MFGFWWFRFLAMRTGRFRKFNVTRVGVVRRLDNVIYSINSYPADKCWKNNLRHPLKQLEHCLYFCWLLRKRLLSCYLGRQLGFDFPSVLLRAQPPYARETQRALQNIRQLLCFFSPLTITCTRFWSQPKNDSLRKRKEPEKNGRKEVNQKLLQFGNIYS